MKIVDAIFIDKRNKEQVKWWNNVARRLVRFELLDKIVVDETGKDVGYIFAVKGVLKNFVVKANRKFIKNPKTVTFSIKK